MPRRALVYALTYGILWWVLTRGAWDAWWIGAPVVLLATWISLRLTVTPVRWRLSGILRFLPFFLWRSLVGGFDVARRAYQWNLPLDPGMIRYTLRLPPQSPAAAFFVALVGLLPGSLCAGIEGDALTVHVIDRRQPVAHYLEALERHVARVFGESWGEQTS